MRKSQNTPEIQKTFWSVFKSLHNTSTHLLKFLHLPPVLSSVLTVSHFSASQSSFPSCLCHVRTSVRVAFTDTASSQPVYKHDVTCVPISARLSCRHSRLCRQRNPEKTKSLELFWFLFCLRILFIYLSRLSDHPSVCLCFFAFASYMCFLLHL